MPRERGEKVVATNRKARHDYAIEDVFEAGIVLTGTEVKSLRAGRASLVDGYASVEHGGTNSLVKMAKVFEHIVQHEAFVGADRNLGLLFDHLCIHMRQAFGQ